MSQDYKKIFKQMGFSYISFFLVSFSGILLISLLTKSLSITDYGIYVLLATTVGFLTILLEFGISQYIMYTFPGLRNSKKIMMFFSLFLILIAILLVILLVVFIPPIQNIIISLLKLQNYRIAFIVGLTISVMLAILRIITAYLTSKKMLIIVSTIPLLSQVLWTIVLLILFILRIKFNLFLIMILWLTSSIISIIFSLFFIKKDVMSYYKKIRISPKIVIDGVLFGFPLLFLVGNFLIVDIADRYIINFMLGVNELAYYNMIYSILGFIVAFGSIVQSNFFPYIAASVNKKDQKFKEYFRLMVKYVFLIVAPCLAGIFFMSKPIILMIATADYVPTVTLTLSLILFPLFASMVHLVYPMLLLKKKTFETSLIFALGAIINILLNIWLIPKIGLVGAGIATTVAYFIIMILLFWKVLRTFEINLYGLKIFAITASSLIMGILVYFIHPENFIEKISVIILGFLIYVSLILVLRVISKNEMVIVKDFLNKAVPSFLLSKKK